MFGDIRFALRTFSASKLFGLTAILTFALGIGATATVFSVIDAVLLRPPEFANPGSVVHVQTADERGESDNLLPSVFEQVRSRSDLFIQAAGSRGALFTVTRVPAPDQIFGASVTGDLFQLLGAKPWLGRVLNARDERSGARAVAVLSYRGWQKLFVADTAVLGKTATIDGEPFEIVGVMPRDFVIPGQRSVLWTPLKLSPAEMVSPDARQIEIVRPPTASGFSDPGPSSS